MSARENALRCLMDAAATSSLHRRAVFFAMAQVWLRLASRIEGQPVTASDVLRVSLDESGKGPGAKDGVVLH